MALFHHLLVSVMAISTITAGPSRPSKAPVTTSKAPVTTSKAPVTTTKAPVILTFDRLIKLLKVSRFDSNVIKVGETVDLKCTSDAALKQCTIKSPSGESCTYERDGRWTNGSCTSDLNERVVNPYSYNGTLTLPRNPDITMCRIRLTITEADVGEWTCDWTTTKDPISTTQKSVTIPKAPVTAKEALVTTSKAPVTTTEASFTASKAPVTTKNIFTKLGEDPTVGYAGMACAIGLICALTVTVAVLYFKPRRIYQIQRLQWESPENQSFSNETELNTFAEGYMQRSVQNYWASV